MDLIATPTDDGTAWDLTDLLGRAMGRIAKTGDSSFAIHPNGHAVQTMDGIAQGPFASLDAALAEIEKHTHGVCRRVSGQDQP